MPDIPRDAYPNSNAKSEHASAASSPQQMPPQRTVSMNFGEALQALKNGQKVARSGWEVLDTYVYYVPAQSYPAVTEIAKKEFGDTVPYEAYLALKTGAGSVVPWNIPQPCIFADDWQIVE